MKKKFMIESPHTKEECLKALDETVAMGNDHLEKFNWGCMAGKHTAWALVEADNTSEARNLVSPLIRDKAHVFEVSKITPRQIQAFHQD
jgi:hypothetical protein